MPQLDDYSLSIIEKINDLPVDERTELLMEAIDLPDFLFVNFQAVDIQNAKDVDFNILEKEFWVAVYTELDWENDEDEEVFENIRGNQLFERSINYGDDHIFYFRVPSYDEVRNGFPYFRNVYKI